ncbi:DUF1206 domain-containing protein [Pseudonocardia benzenivorans]|uniref:DUF1206 domain-containing protein n=1 Tax=Pseudonocardia benzenivorans TaxID=228005 RepID=A0ABW3VKY4_9PSEU
MSDAVGTVGGTEDAAREAGRGARIVVRVGILAYGLTHLLLAWLVLRVAFGDRGSRADQSGAFQAIAQTTAGRVLLWVLALGFVAVALWRVGEALGRAGGRVKDARGRLESAGMAVVFAALTVLAVRTAVSGSGGEGSQAAAAGLLGIPGGQWIVGAVGVGIVVVAGFITVNGFRCTFTDDMSLPLDPRARAVAVRTGQLGKVAKGLVTVLVGVLVVVAAVQFEPQRANGLDAALKTLAAQPFGVVLLVATAVGLVAFGVFCAFDARYHRV